MIRKTNILTSCLLLGLLLLTACYDYDRYPDTVSEQPSKEERLVNADSLYLNLSITNIAGITRATEVGTADENAIYDGILCIFEGANASTAILKTATVIDQLVSNPNPSDAHPRPLNGGTETQINITQRLAEGTHAYGSNLYALVLLNTTKSGFKANANMLYHNGSSQSAKTLAQIQALTLNSVGSPDEHVGLFMSNDALEPITPASHLFDTETEAATNFDTGHININVARAAAKVTIHSDLTSGDNITNITLNTTTTKAKFHTMRWMLTPEPGYTDIDFTDFHQQALKSDDVVYVKPGSGFSVVVELQVKDGSFLIDEAYKYQSGNDIRFFTDLQPLIEYLKERWTNSHHNNNLAISTRTAAEVFRHPTFYINDDGSVNVTLTNDIFTGEGEQDALVSYASTLGGLLNGYRDAKMYFTYTVGNLAANNSYTLTFEDSSITGIGRPTPTPPTP